MAREIVTSENRKEYMEKKLGTPMSEREAPVHMGNWMKKYKENEDQIDGHLKNVGLGWKLKEGTYIDGVSIQSIKQLSQDIRSNAIERY